MITVKEVRSFQRNVKKAWNKLEEMFTKHVKSVLHLILNKALTFTQKDIYHRFSNLNEKMQSLEKELPQWTLNIYKEFISPL